MKSKLTELQKWKLNVLLRMLDQCLNIEYFDNGKEFGFRRISPPFKLFT